ncbi:hypothetical protein L345_09242, partial [Ophiophagus hannah]
EKNFTAVFKTHKDLGAQKRIQTSSKSKSPEKHSLKIPAFDLYGEWCCSITVPIFKRGDVSVDFHPNSLLKVSLINLYAKHLYEKLNSLYAILIDLKAAFDLISRQRLWKQLLKYLWKDASLRLIIINCTAKIKKKLQKEEETRDLNHVSKFSSNPSMAMINAAYQKPDGAKPNPSIKMKRPQRNRKEASPQKCLQYGLKFQPEQYKQIKRERKKQLLLFELEPEAFLQLESQGVDKTAYYMQLFNWKDRKQQNSQARATQEIRAVCSHSSDCEKKATLGKAGKDGKLTVTSFSKPQQSANNITKEGQSHILKNRKFRIRFTVGISKYFIQFKFQSDCEERMKSQE